MNTKRCELCGTLHGRESGNVTIGVYNDAVDYTTHDHYNLCQACALKVYDFIDGLKESDGSMPKEQSATHDLIQRQNAELIKLRMCLRNAANDLYRANKFVGKPEYAKGLAETIKSALKWIHKGEFSGADEY